MKLQSIEIKNFRNFKNNKIDLDNKNIIIGKNNVGKSNLIFAIRLLLDKELRNYELVESDFFQKNIKEEAEITLEMENSLSENKEEFEKILSQVGPSILQRSMSKFYIKLILSYENRENEVTWYWGSDLNELEKVNGTMYRSPIYNLFNVVYMSANISLEETFKKEKNSFFKKFDLTNQNLESDPLLVETISQLNNNVKGKDEIQNAIVEINNNLIHFDRKNYEVSIESNVQTKGLNSQLQLFMKDIDQKESFPIAGDGVKKKVSYAFLDLMKKDENNSKITIYLFEEPENFLFYASHFELARKLNNSEKFKFSFLVTHNPIYIDFKDKIKIIKLIKNNSDILSRSSNIDLCEKLKNLKMKALVSDLATAIFFDNVLIVEGYSEEVLFNFIFEQKNVDMESIFVLKVLSSGLANYLEILKNLEVNCYVKTDNDLKNLKESQYGVIGLNRCIKILNSQQKNKQFELHESIFLDDKEDLEKMKIKIYEKNSELINSFIENKIWISKVDLENDLYEVLGLERCNELINKNFVKWLQTKKWQNMVELINKLNDIDIEKIINSKYFSFLKELI